MEQQQKLNITLDKTTKVVCEECGCDQFQESLFIRKASKFIIGSKQDALIPIPTFSCVKCHHVNEDMLPPDLKAEIEEQ